MSLHKESRRLRLGVLGCGPIAQIAHFDACRKARNVELYALCDVATDLRARMAALWQPTASYGAFDEMLDDANVDAVIIAAADEFHAELAQQALARGKHVLVEKPLAVSVEECVDLQRAAQASACILQVANNRRFDPAVAFAREFAAEELGQRISLRAWYHDSRFRYAMTDNLQPVVVASDASRRPVGAPKSDRQRYYLLTHGSHLVDVVRCLGGDIAGVRARFLQRCGAFCWFVEATFADGSLGQLDLTVAVQGDFEEGFSLQGEYGSINGRLHLPWYHKAGFVECFSARTGVYSRPLGADAYTYKLQLEAFADAILHDKPQRGANLEDGSAAVRALVAIARAAESGLYVSLDDATGSV